MKYKFRINRLSRLAIFTLTFSLVGTILNLDYTSDVYANDKVKVNLSSRNTVEESVDLSDAFNLSGIATDYDGNNYEVIDNDLSYYKITKGLTQNGNLSKYNNKITLGKSDIDHTRQSIALTSKYSIDFNRKFELRGRVNLSSMPDGFAIGFHTNRDYKNRNAGGSLGVYSDPSYNNADYPGISNAVVFEVDTFNNYIWSPNDSLPFGNPFNDTIINDNREDKGRHLAINMTDNDGVVKEEGRKNYFTDDNYSSLLNKDIEFRVEWDPAKNEFTGVFGGWLVRKNIGDNANILKKNPVYYTVSTVLFLGFKDDINFNLNTKNSIELYSYKYTDINPIIKTKVDIPSGKDYAIAGEDILITHTFKNDISSNTEFNDFLDYGAFSYGGYKFDSTNIRNIKVGSDLNNLQSYNGRFDASNSIPIKFNIEKRPYYVQYQIHVTDLKKYGEFDKLVYHVKVGMKGMSQIHNFGEIYVKNAPALYADRGNGKINIYDIGKLHHFNNKNALLDMLWNSVYFKTENDKSSIRLLKEKTDYQNVSINWEYNKDLKSFGNKNEKLESLLQNNKFKNGEIYSIKLTAVDKSDPRLMKSFYKYVVISDHVNNGFNDNSGWMSYIFASNLSDIKETELVVKNKEKFTNYVKEESKVRGLKINSLSGNAEIVEKDKINVNTDGWINRKQHAIKKPGKHIILLNFNENKNVKVETDLKVTDNIWSSYKYDKDGKIIELSPDGISGFIAIPSVINLKNDNKQIVGNTEIYFVNYATDDTKFDLSVDKTFEIKNNKNNSSITMTSSSTNGINKDLGSKLQIGTIDSTRVKGKGFQINFTGSNENTLGVKGKWDGQLSFHFNRIQ